MKERINMCLRVVRKFGFIMAAVLMFPYVSAVPVVMASDGESELPSHDISLEELGRQYEELEAIRKAELDYQIYLEDIIKEDWFVEVEEGIYHLEIPYQELNEIDMEAVNFVKSSLQKTQELMKDGIIEYDSVSNEYSIVGVDDDFVIQAGINKVVYYYFSVFGVKFYTSYKVWLDNYRTEKIVDILNAAGAVATLATALSAAGVITWFGAVPAGIVAASLWALSGVINVLNWNDRGIIIQQYHAPYPIPGGSTQLKVGYVWAQ